jgi:phosphoribosyl-ATP pyrophosphohydrolase
MNSEHSDILQAVYGVVQSRKGAAPESSYTASLMHKGIDKVLKKLGEEATELVIAGKGGVREEMVSEAADLFFHALVLLAYRDVPLDAVYDELRRRFGTSGHVEKAARLE